MKEYRIRGFAGVKDEKGRLFFGGSQDWYRKKWKRMAGCASVAAANLAAFYGLGIGTDQVLRSRDHAAEEDPGRENGQVIYTKREYLSLMEKMYAVMRPGPFGFPFSGLFRKRFIAYAARNGVHLEGRSLTHWKDSSVPLAFIIKALSANDPVAMLILRHRSPGLNHLTWHWMTITAYSPREGNLTISNYGREEKIPAKILLDPSFGNIVKLLSFRNADSIQKGKPPGYGNRE